MRNHDKNSLEIIAKQRADELQKKYGKLAGDVANLVLANIPVQFVDHRDIWIRIVNFINIKKS